MRTNRLFGLLLALLLLLPAPVFAQAALFDGSAAFPQFFANDGTELAAGTLSFFASGTSTPQPVYSDATLATPLTNPYTLNGSGRAPVIYLSAVAYKVILKDSGGTTIATADPVYGAAYLATQAVQPTVQTTTSTGTVNDFATSSTTAPTLILRANNATDLTLTGFTAPTVSQRLIIVSIGAGNVFLAHQSASSSAA